eukprot:TRINITY_DN2894_c0_g1_i1.p1 TRINITY_DN2894_c0_g1~~TRINITY_DN2894_c0_g1_i1.p1  ORF type:complete len:187 (-),score=45.33 TRINITY_DN2894_c0_g1_i1:226-759(-)
MGATVILSSLYFVKWLYNLKNTETNEKLVNDDDTNVGLEFFYGINRKINVKEAIEIFFERKNNFAILMRQFLRKEYDSMDRICLEIINYESNPKQAYFVLGWMSEEGNGKNKNLQESFHFYQKAADLGHPVALSKLAWMYERGIHVEKDFKKAIDYYKLSAMRGYSYSTTFSLVKFC